MTLKRFYLNNPKCHSEIKNAGINHYGVVAFQQNLSYFLFQRMALKTICTLPL